MKSSTFGLGLISHSKLMCLKPENREPLTCLWAEPPLKGYHREYVEGRSVITGPKCNKGPICNNILNAGVIKILPVITFGPKCNKDRICKSYLYTQTGNIPTTNYGR